jgi:hypothetical protein
MAAEEVDLRYAAEFAEIARELHQETEQQPTLERVTKLAVQTISPCHYCGVSVRDSHGRVTTPASTDPIVNLVDEQQYELGEGPSLDAIWTLETCLIDDMDRESRWPRWAAEASRLGVKSILSIRLEPPRGHLHAALNLYSTTPRAFDLTDHAIAGVFARHAANALAVTQDRDQLEAALRSRQIIGIAEGILMQRFGLTLDQSFELLRRYSGNHNIKLRVLAENLVKAGTIPHARPGSPRSADDLLGEAFKIEPPAEKD